MNSWPYALFAISGVLVLVWSVTQMLQIARRNRDGRKDDPDEDGHD